MPLSVLDIMDLHSGKDLKGLLGALEWESEVASNRDPAVRGEAAGALGKMGDRRAVGPLARALDRDPDLMVRARVAWALGELGDPRAREPLMEALEWAGIGPIFDEVIAALGKLDSTER